MYPKVSSSCRCPLFLAFTGVSGFQLVVKYHPGQSRARWCHEQCESLQWRAESCLGASSGRAGTFGDDDWCGGLLGSEFQGWYLAACWVAVFSVQKWGISTGKVCDFFIPSSWGDDSHWPLFFHKPVENGWSLATFFLAPQSQYTPILPPFRKQKTQAHQ